MNRYRFFFNEAVESLWRARTLTFTTVTIIAISLVLVGLFYLSILQVDGFMGRLREDFQVIAYLREGVDPKVLEGEMAQVRATEGVAGVEYISPAMAREMLLSDLAGEERQVAEAETAGLVLPSALRITFRDVSRVRPMAEKLQKFSYVEEVAYGQGMVNTLGDVVSLYNGFSALCIGLLGLACIFIVGNTIKLNIINRLQEIEIMKLVGATSWFIRWPFLIEGFIQGFLGAAIAVLVIAVTYPVVLGKLSNLIPLITSFSGAWLLFKLATKLMIFGSLLGSLGSLFSLKNLKAV